MDNPYYEKLMNAALGFMSFRPRSEKELVDFLQKKLSKWKVSGSVLMQKVVDRMRDLGYVDDRKFVSWWVTQRISFRPKGKRALLSELRKKGIDKEDIESELLASSSESDGFDEYRLAQKAIEKKLGMWATLPRIEQKKRAYTFLSTRGFSSETISRIIDEIHLKGVQ